MADPAPDALLSAAKSFLARCTDEGLIPPALCPAAKAFLELAGAESKKEGRTMKAADMLEQAAKLTWAMKHADKLVDFQSLLDEEQMAMATLYRGGKGRSEMQRIQRWARALISPEPSPIKPVGAAADVDKALAAAEGAARAAAREIPVVARSIRPDRDLPVLGALRTWLHPRRLPHRPLPGSE
jgi:hypothetical protein